MMMKPSVLAAWALVFAPTAVSAQAPPAPATPPAQTAPPNLARANQNCAPTEAVPRDGTVAPSGTTTGRAPDEALGDKLARSDGVLCPPPGVDPDMHAPTPQGGVMPVIPPPGDPSVRPK